MKKLVLLGFALTAAAAAAAFVLTHDIAFLCGKDGKFTLLAGKKTGGRQQS